MNNFDFQNSTSVKIVTEKMKFTNPVILVLRYIIYFSAIIFTLALLASLSGYIILSPVTIKIFTIILGIEMISIFYFSFLEHKYFHLKPKVNLADAVKGDYNLADYFDNTCVEIIKDSFIQAEKFGYLKIDSVIILNSLQNTEEGRYIFSRIGANQPEAFAKIISRELSTLPKGKGKVSISENMTKSFLEAINHAISFQGDKITVGDIIVGILRTDKTFQEIIFELHLKPEEVENVIRWYHLLKEKLEKIPFWKKDTFGTSIAQDWSFGYTPYLSRFAYDMNENQERIGKIHIYGRKKEINDMERILSKNTENNVVLIGDKGIGKKSIVEGLVLKIRLGEVMPALQHCHIYKLDTGAVLSGAGQQGEIEQRLIMIFNEAVKAGNIILFIEDFHSLVASKKDVGKINASEILSPYLKGSLRIIASTFKKNYYEDIEANPSVAQSLEKIEVKETDEATTLEILEETVPYIEMRSRVFFTFQDLKEVVRLSKRYISEKPFPEKAIELLDEVAAKAAQSGSKYIDIKIIDQIVSEKTEVPVAEPEGGEKEKLINLEKFLHERIIGQDEAISAIANAVRRARSGLAPKNRPIGTFLFLGPTGVGKTETAKALAEAYFGSEKTMIRFDMSEFQVQSSVYRLIGAPPSAGQGGTKGELVTRVKDKPFSLILLDEMEKAYPEILTLFLQVFDEGFLSTGEGEKINFQNTIIICTSNAGSELIRENLKKGIAGEDLKKILLENLQSRGVFRPEFLNRFDGVIAFHPLSTSDINKITMLMLNELSKKMEEKEITLEFTDKAIAKLAKIGYDPVYGARPMRRTIQEKVENSIAQKLLSGEIKRGDKIVLDEKDI